MLEDLSETLKNVSKQRLFEQVRQITIRKKVEQTEQIESDHQIQAKHQGVVMQELTSTEYVIQEDLRTAEYRTRREHHREDTFEVIMNICEGVPTPLHVRIMEIICHKNKVGLPPLKSCDRSKSYKSK